MTTNIVVVGITGAGKSAFCNTVSKTNDFEEGDSSSPITRQSKSLTFSLDDKQATVVDTVGLDDITLSTTSILQSIAKACRELLNGRIHQLFYVVAGVRVTQRQVQQLDEIQQTIFTPGIKNYTTVVRTRYTRFQVANAVTSDEATLRQEVPQLFNLCTKMVYVDNDPQDIDKRNASANLLRTYVYQLANYPPYSEAIVPLPISFQERDEIHQREQAALLLRQQQEREELERRRQEEQRRQAAELERRNRELQEAQRRHQEQMERERKALEEARLRHQREMASLGAARSTGGAVREYQVQSTSTGQFFKLNGNGSFNVSGEALHLTGDWSVAQQGYSFGGHIETVLGDVKDMNIRGNITITSNLTIRNLNCG